MSEATPIEKLSLSHTFVVFYVFLVSFAHEFGYWRKFHIQLLEHIGLADLPKLAIWPIAATAGTLLTVSFFTAMLTAAKLPPGGGANTPAGQIVNQFRSVIRLIGVFLALIGVFSFFVTRFAYFWYGFGPALIALGIGIAVDLKSALAPIGIKIPSYAEFLFVLTPCLAFGTGQFEATNIISGRHYLEARFTNSGLTLRYLGRAGDYVFFYDSGDLDTALYKLESIQPLTLKYKTSEKTQIGE